MPTAMEPMALNLSLPWEIDTKQEEKFKRQLRRILLLLLLLFIIVPFLPTLESIYEEPEEEITVTKLILKPTVQPEPEIIPEKKVEPPKPAKQAPKPKEKAPPKPKAAAITTPKKQSSGSAKKTAVKSKKVEKKVSVQSSQGLNKLSNQLTALRGSLDLSKLQKRNLSKNTVGSVAQSNRQKLGTDQVNRKSGGINIDGSVLRNESTSLAEHTTTAVDGLVVSGSGPSGEQSYSSSQQGRRDMENIRFKLENAKNNIYSLYQRSLLENPELAGKFVFELLIEPDGSISDLQLISSDLDFSDLENNMLSRIKNVNFGAEDVAKINVQYTFVFVPQ